MGEARRRAVHGGYFGDAAPAAFVRAWLAAAAQPDAYLDLGSGVAGDVPVVVATLGPFTAALTVAQARGTADSFVTAIETGKFDTLVDRMSDLVVALRAAADMVDEAHAAPMAEVLVLPGLGV